MVFGSDAPLVPGEVEDFAGDVYLRDVQAGTTEAISGGGGVRPAQRGPDD